MTVRLYSSTDASAPVLTGQAGSLTTLLDAVLVNGYGSKTAAGWTIAYTATNKRAYRQNLTGANLSTGALMYVDDTGPGSAGAREARFCGFETMSAITPVGTGQFPNSTQSAIGSGQLVMRKSSTNDATARQWWAVADGQILYLFMATGDSPAPNLTACGIMFGDFKSFKSGDAYACMIIGRTIENSTDWRYETMGAIAGNDRNYGVNNNMPGHFFARHWNQFNVSVRGGKLTNSSLLSGETYWAGDNQTIGNYVNAAPGFSRNNPGGFPYPNPIDGALWMAPLWVNQNGIRGYLKGLWSPMHSQPLNPGDTFTVASGNLSGKSFICVPQILWDTNANIRQAQFFIEYSDTWPA